VAALTAVVRPGKPRLGAAAAAAVTSFGLADRLGDSPGDLSYGARRLLAIARALATRPRVLLLDEPAAGLGAGERDELRTLVREIADDWGIAVLIIEHDVELVLGVSDEIVALDFGRVIARGAPADVRRDPAVVASYLGTQNPVADEPAPGEPVPAQEDTTREGQSA
jgi:sulfate-transporting ATPase